MLSAGKPTEAFHRLLAALAIWEILYEWLQAPKGHGKVFNEHMTAAELKERNLAISAGKSSDKLAGLVREKLGISLNAYAGKLGVSAGALSMWRTGKLPCPRKVAERVKRDTGFTAWPKGLKDD